MPDQKMADLIRPILSVTHMYARRKTCESRLVKKRDRKKEANANCKHYRCSPSLQSLDQYHYVIDMHSSRELFVWREESENCIVMNKDVS